MAGRIVRTPLLLCFEGLERIAEAGFPGGDGYPRYNIERVPEGPEGAARLRLVFAVAGFGPEELEIAVADSHLIVRGEQKADVEPRDFLHRGIAARRFQKAFLLADGMEVVKADLNYGLLAIDIVRHRPEATTRIIKIERRDV